MEANGMRGFFNPSNHSVGTEFQRLSYIYGVVFLGTLCISLGTLALFGPRSSDFYPKFSRVLRRLYSKPISPSWALLVKYVIAAVTGLYIPFYFLWAIMTMVKIENRMLGFTMLFLGGWLISHLHALFYWKTGKWKMNFTVLLFTILGFTSLALYLVFLLFAFHPWALSELSIIFFTLQFGIQCIVIHRYRSEKFIDVTQHVSNRGYESTEGNRYIASSATSLGITMGLFALGFIILLIYAVVGISELSTSVRFLPLINAISLTVIDVLVLLMAYSQSRKKLEITPLVMASLLCRVAIAAFIIWNNYWFLGYCFVFFFFSVVLLTQIITKWIPVQTTFSPETFSGLKRDLSIDSKNFFQRYFVSKEVILGCLVMLFGVILAVSFLVETPQVSGPDENHNQQLFAVAAIVILLAYTLEIIGYRLLLKSNWLSNFQTLTHKMVHPGTLSSVFGSVLIAGSGGIMFWLTNSWATFISFLLIPWLCKTGFYLFIMWRTHDYALWKKNNKTYTIGMWSSVIVCMLLLVGWGVGFSLVVSPSYIGYAMAFSMLIICPMFLALYLFKSTLKITWVTIVFPMLSLSFLAGFIVTFLAIEIGELNASIIFSVVSMVLYCVGAAMFVITLVLRSEQRFVNKYLIVLSGSLSFLSTTIATVFLSLYDVMTGIAVGLVFFQVTISLIIGYFFTKSFILPKIAYISLWSLGILVSIGIIGAGIGTGHTFLGVSLAIGQLCLPALILGLMQFINFIQNHMDYFISKTFFPIWRYDVNSQQVHLANAGMLYLLLCFSAVIFWGMLAVVFIEPSWVGVAVAGLGFLIAEFLVCNLLWRENLKYGVEAEWVEDETIAKLNEKAKIIADALYLSSGDNHFEEMIESLKTDMDAAFENLLKNPKTVDQYFDARETLEQRLQTKDTVEAAFKILITRSAHVRKKQHVANFAAFILEKKTSLETSEDKDTFEMYNSIVQDPSYFVTMEDNEREFIVNEFNNFMRHHKEKQRQNDAEDEYEKQKDLEREQFLEKRKRDQQRKLLEKYDDDDEEQPAENPDYNLDDHKFYPVHLFSKKSRTSLDREIREALKRLIQGQGRFIDHDFPASQKSLGTKSNYKWERCSEKLESAHVFNERDNASLSHRIVQGSLGDCWFLAALSVVAVDEKAVKELFVVPQGFDLDTCLKYGVFGVKFFYHGSWETILVDDLIPWKHSSPAFAKSSLKNELWISLMEKAYAKLHGSFQSIVSGHPHYALHNLTSGPSSEYSIQDDKHGELWPKIIEFIEMNHLITCSSISGSQREELKRNGIVGGHAYSILDAREICGERLLCLRNPWGKHEWKGAWSDDWPHWTEKMKKLVNLQRADDGKFWMSFEDFCLQFSRLSVCRIFGENEWQRHKDNHKWTNETSGWKNISKAPRYFINTKGKTNIYLSLTQHTPRQSPVAIALIVLSGETSGSHNSKNEVKRTTYNYNHNLSVDVVLPENNKGFTVIATVYDPVKVEEEVNFTLKVYSDAPIVCGRFKT